MGFLEERDLSDVPTIPEFYKGKTIFITGGTEYSLQYGDGSYAEKSLKNGKAVTGTGTEIKAGFIGKVLIEKLLYSCSELNKIYLLLRSKKNESPVERLAKLHSSVCFSRLPPGLFESKVFLISGDVMEPGLGMSPEDREMLVNQVNIIFHVAASVRFDDTLKFAIRMNLKGTIETLALANEVKDLCVFVHVSTSYSNTNRDPIEEILYPPLADWRDTLAVCDKIDDYTLKTLTPKYLGEMPNTYTFSKQLAEHAVSEYRGQLPIVIVRPSIVVASLAEPLPAWVENFNGPVGIFIACGKGIMRTFHSKPDIVCDYIPVDACVKHIVATAWIRGTKKLEPTDDIQIYNCCNNNLFYIKMNDLVEMSKRISAQIPLDNILWNIGGNVTSSETIYYFRVIFQHLLPAILVDMILWLVGKKPMLVKIQRRIYTAGMALRYYLTQQWTFDHTNFLALRSSLKEEDRDSFSYMETSVDIPTYFMQCCYGGRRFLLKEKDENIPHAKIHHKRMLIVDKVFQLVFYGAIFYWILQKLIQYYITTFQV